MVNFACTTTCFKRHLKDIYPFMLHGGGLCALSCCRERTTTVFCYCCPFFCCRWQLQYNVDVHEGMGGRVVKLLGNKQELLGSNPGAAKSVGQ